MTTFELGEDFDDAWLRARALLVTYIRAAEPTDTITQLEALGHALGDTNHISVLWIVCHTAAALTASAARDTDQGPRIEQLDRVLEAIMANVRNVGDT